MKRDKNFFFFIIMICFIFCYTTSLILASRTVEALGLTITGSILVYPATYFLAILFKERYGDENTKMMFVHAIFSLIFMVLLLTVSSVLPYKMPDGLEKIFNIDFKFVFASIASFIASHYLCLYLYNYLSGFRGFKFLISSVISITVDSIIFIGLAYLGDISFGEISRLFVGQYVFNILMIIVYTALFTYIIDSVVNYKKKKKTIKKEENKKRTTKKV